MRDFEFSKKLAELLVLRLNGWNILHYDSEIYFFPTRQNEFKEFFSQELIWYFVMTFDQLCRFLYTYTI